MLTLRKIGSGNAAGCSQYLTGRADDEREAWQGQGDYYTGDGAHVGELTMSERSALARVDRAGPAMASDLARAEQISPQSIAVTVNALEARALVQRTADPADGRRALLSITTAGSDVLRSRRDARVQQLAAALTADFSPRELRALAEVTPLLERLAEGL